MVTFSLTELCHFLPSNVFHFSPTCYFFADIGTSQFVKFNFYSLRRYFILRHHVVCENLLQIIYFELVVGITEQTKVNSDNFFQGNQQYNPYII